MISRYTRNEMGLVWTDQNRYHAWLQVEFEVCRELALEGKIPEKDWKELEEKVNQLLENGGVDAKRVEHFEKTTRHDVIAFTSAVAEVVGPTSRFIHFGLTSSDVIDTALGLLIKKSGVILMEDIENLLVTLKKRALEYQKTPTIGRSHGISAEPTSFGLKFLGWFCEWQRNKKRLQVALENCRVGKLSGAVGVNSHWSPEFESSILNKLGLEREPVATQVIPRDRHAELLNTFALIGASLERISVELRHLQRTEVNEVHEGFSKGQKGSSAMPHKKNPISSENITGCARLLRSYAQAQLENVALWHERDISHSSVERITIPDGFILADYATHRMVGVIENLVVNKKQIEANLNLAGPAVFSGHLLLALVEAGALREEAYYWVQSCAHEILERKGSQEDFQNLLSAHPEIQKYLKPEKIKELGSLEHQLRNVQAIYDQVFR